MPDKLMKKTTKRGMTEPVGGLKGSKASPGARGSVPRMDSKRKAGTKAGSLKKFRT